MYVFLQHSCYSVHTQSIHLNAPPVPLLMQPAMSSTVRAHAGESTTKGHTVRDPVAHVVSDLVLKHARTSSSIQ